MPAGMTARNRPISAACGTATGPRRRAGNRFDPSTSTGRCRRAGPSSQSPAHRTSVRRYDRSVPLLLLVDLDGVVYRGADPVPGVAAVLADRAERGDDVVYVTNNSMHYRADYVPRLAAMGAPVAADRVVTSARATAMYLQDHEPASAACSSSVRAGSNASCATSVSRS